MASTTVSGFAAGVVELGPRPQTTVAVATAQSIAASTTFTSTSVAVAGYKTATLFYTFDLTSHDRTLQASDDNAVWYELSQGGLMAANPNATAASNTPLNRAIPVPLAGVASLRIVIKNNIAAIATLNAKWVLQ